MRFTLFCACLIVAPVGVICAGDSPAAPPVKLATNGEAPPEFAASTAQDFLPLLDLSLPELAKVKALAEQEDWTGALDTYRDLLIDHIKELTRDQRLGAMHPHWNYSGSEDLLEGYVLIGRHAGGVSVNYLGYPGVIDWFKIGVDKVQGAPEGVLPDASASSDRDFCTHLSSMHQFAPLAEAYCSGKVARRRQGPVEGDKSGPTAAEWVQIRDSQPPHESGDLRYLKAWLGTWEDFARRHKPGYAAVQAAGRMSEYNSLGASQYQKLFVSWRIGQFWAQFERICQRLPEDQYGEVSSVALAVILTELIENHAAVVAKSIGGVPNQAAHAVSTIMETVVAMPGLRMGPVWADAARNQVTQYYTTINLPDGTNTEQAINYNKGNPGLLVNMIKLYPDRPGWIQELVPYAERTLVYLASMLRNGSHPGALPRWGQDDRSEEALLRGYLEYLPNVDVERIVARVYGPGDQGDPSFTSAQFPYSGYYVLRDGWRKDDAFCIFKASPRAYGHARNDNTSIHLGAFGRDLLVDSGSGTYGNHPINAYLNGSFSKNTIAVDGRSQDRTQIGFGNRGGVATAKAPQPNRWHTSATFDFAEGVYDAGYEDPAIEVRHARQVIALRGLALWIVIDRLRGEMTPMPADEPHTYTQVWNFADSFTKEQVHTAENAQCAWSADPEGANVAIYNFGTAPVTYRKWYGDVLDDGTHRGWVRDSSPEAKTPAVDVHATWTGSGEQLIVTMIEARDGTAGRIAEMTPLAQDGIHGFRAVLVSGQTITCLAALDDAPLSAAGVAMQGGLLVTLAAGDLTRGLALDVQEWESAGHRVQVGNFEFALSKGALTDIQEIRYPEGALPRRPGLGDILVDEGSLSKGLLARWSFDQMADGVVYDVSGHGHDGTVENAALTSGAVGDAIEFTGRGHMVVPHQDSLNLTEGFTISAWIRLPVGLEGFRSIVYKEGGGYDFSLLRMTVRNPDGNGDVSGALPRDGQWHHVVARWDKTDGWLRLYADRWEVAQRQCVNPPTISDGDLLIGIRNPKTGDGAFQGCLDELRIYNRPLSDREIWTLYHRVARKKQ